MRKAIVLLLLIATMDMIKVEISLPTHYFSYGAWVFLPFVHVLFCLLCIVASFKLCCV